MDETWNKYFEVDQETWNETVKNALKIWDDLEDIDKSQKELSLQTDKCPMHPQQFFALSSVNGFNRCNGYTYSDYVDKWRRIQKSL